MTGRDVGAWLSSVDDLLDHSDTERSLSRDAMRWEPTAPLAEQAGEDDWWQQWAVMAETRRARWANTPQIAQWPSIGALSPDDLVTLQASMRRFAAVVAEAMRVAATTYQQIGAAVLRLLAEQPPPDPRARALRLRQDRDTGPGWRYRPDGQRVTEKGR